MYGLANRHDLAGQGRVEGPGVERVDLAVPVEPRPLEQAHGRERVGVHLAELLEYGRLEQRGVEGRLGEQVEDEVLLIRTASVCLLVAHPGKAVAEGFPEGASPLLVDGGADLGQEFSLEAVRMESDEDEPAPGEQAARPAGRAPLVGSQDQGPDLGRSVEPAAEPERQVGSVHAHRTRVAFLAADAQKQVRHLARPVLRQDRAGPDDLAGRVFEHELIFARWVGRASFAERPLRTPEPCGQELPFGRQVRAVEVTREFEDRFEVGRAGGSQAEHASFSDSRSPLQSSVIACA